MPKKGGFKTISAAFMQNPFLYEIQLLSLHRSWSEVVGKVFGNNGFNFDKTNMAEFNSCNWCGKVYRLKRGFLTGLVLNRKYCTKACKAEAEGGMRFSFQHHPHKILKVFGKKQEHPKMSDKSRLLIEIED